MNLKIIAIGKNMPNWVDIAVKDYQKRFSSNWKLEVIEVPEKKQDKITSYLPKDCVFVLLDVKGKIISTEQLADKLEKWQLESKNLCLAIGAADGLPSVCYEGYDYSWSLSKLTMPHPMVRVIVAEQLYRAYSILQNHPYHRG